MKIVFVTLLLCCVLAQAAVRYGVYDSQYCGEGSLIGFVWYPSPYYNEGMWTATSCADMGFSFYFYDIKVGLPEKTQADFDNSFNYFRVGDGADFDSCNKLTDKTGVVYATNTTGACIPFKEIRFNPPSKASFRVDSCNATTTSFSYAFDNADCDLPAYYDTSPTCTSDVIFSQGFCKGYVAPPTTSSTLASTSTPGSKSSAAMMEVSFAAMILIGFTL